LIPASIVAPVIIAEDTNSSSYRSPSSSGGEAWERSPQLLPQLQTPEQKGGASPIDALMPASTEGLQ